MAIPVLVSAELFPFNDINGTMLPDAIVALNKELKDFFADKAEIISTPADMSNLTDVTTVFGSGLDEQEAFVQATVVVGFRGVDLHAAKDLAAAFAAAHSGKLFNRISVEVLDPATVANPVAQV
jgi:hypothetical protein